MRNIKFIGKKNFNPPQRQRGVVLLITLIVLVAMMLAGIGMMRSIDTTTMIAGNMAFREATLHAGDKGMNQAFSDLLQIASNPTDKIILSYNNGSAPAIAPAPGVAAVNVCPGSVNTKWCIGAAINIPGYSSTPLAACEVFPPGSPGGTACAGNQNLWWTLPINWVSAPAIQVRDPNAPLAAEPIATVYYLIHRMCTQADTTPNGVAASGQAQVCQTIQENVAVTGSSMQVGTTKFTATSIYYRVTTKSVGPRNTVTYAQEMILIPE